MLELLARELNELIASAQALSTLDVLTTFAERAVNLDFCLPQLSDSPGIEIEGGRHPVVEQVTAEAFVANDLCLNQQQKMLIITGPNMGGHATKCWPSRRV